MPAVCHIIRMQRTLSAWLFVQIIVCLRFWRICRNIDMHMSMQSCDEKIPEEPKPSRMLLTSLFIVPVSCRWCGNIVFSFFFFGRVLQRRKSPSRAIFMLGTWEVGRESLAKFAPAVVLNKSVCCSCYPHGSTACRCCCCGCCC